MESIAKAPMGSCPRTPTGLHVPNPSPFFPSSSSSQPLFSSPVSRSSNTLLRATPPAVVVSPCGACKILRRRCGDKCVLAPYFPPSEPVKFTIAHRVFGASNIIKLLQEVAEDQRADAVSSMVYEANARMRDPVYGSAGAICYLQKQVSELQSQLARAQADLINMQLQRSKLIALFCEEMGQSSEENHTPSPFSHPHWNSSAATAFHDDPSTCGPVWT